MKKILLIISICLLCLITVNNSIKAQTPPDCVTVLGCEWTTIGDGERDVEVSPGCILRVQWQFRECPPNFVREFRILGWSLIGENCGNYSASTLKELALFGILDGFGDPSIPNCGEGDPITTVNIYTASCVYEQVCTYTYPGAPTVSCNPSGTTPPVPLTSVRTTRRHIPCGTVCCKTTFEVCKFTPTTGGLPYIKVRKVGPSQAIGVCVDPNPLPPGAICFPICN